MPQLPPEETVLARERRRIAAGARLFATALTVPSPESAPLAGAARGRLRWLQQLVPLAFVAVLLPVTVEVLTHSYGLTGGVSGALAVAQTAPLLLVASRPLTAWWLVFAADLAGALAVLGAPAAERPWPWTPMVIIGYLLLCLGLGLRERRSTVVAVWAVTSVVSLASGLVAQERSEGTNVLLVVLSGVALFVGVALRERAEARRKLAEQQTISEAERAGRTLLEERTRIARELHDVVAHHMSVITVQADSAPYRLSDVPREAEQEFASIAAAAREALAEMRRLLGVLRSEETRSERVPQPGLERLPQLVEATVRGGVPVEHSDASTRRLPQAVSLSAYRIVQEALANVVRHAPGARTRVDIGEEAGRLNVLVVNEPSPHPESAPLESAGTGHGLVGMRERVRLLGGAVEASPRPDGGFLVAAWLPLAGTEAPMAKDTKA
ncbi:sensor histidine kinase [Streptomyces sulphureus]|uniref:sensor histidine kinase n=1 Tax=Streptomyces sulphureus TaxID=47758 RepID=UPI00037FE3CC|nr:histidine kinase [Streptomyces sulphureus]